MKRLPALFFLVIALTGTSMHAQTSGGPVNNWQASLTAETGKDYDKALSDLAAYQQNGGDPFLANLRAGWIYYLKQDYPDAIKSYNEAVRLQPSAINPLLGLLNIAEAQKNAADTEKAVESVLRIDPLNYRAQMTGAAQQFGSKNYSQAVAGYRRVLTYYPDDLEARSGEAWSLYNLGDLKGATGDFQLLIGINPDYPYAKQGLALCQAKATN